MTDVKSINAVGLRCPQPVLKLATMMPNITKGDIVEIQGDCPTFEEDIRTWCERMKKTFLAANQKDGVKTIRIMC